LLFGIALGIGLAGGHMHGAWAAAAGVVVGVASALAARSYPVLAAIGGGVLVVLTSVLIMAWQQWRMGHWPQTNPDMTDHYGTPEQAVIRVTFILLLVICVPCAVSAAIAAFAKRRAA
jgi:hypothetical protein